MTTETMIEEKVGWFHLRFSSVSDETKISQSWTAAEIEDWLRTTLAEVVADEHKKTLEYALAIVTKYEAMGCAPTTFARIKSSLTSNQEIK